MTLSPSAASPAAAGLPDADLLARLRALVGAIPDPEIPVVSLAELASCATCAGPTVHRWRC